MPQDRAGKTVRLLPDGNVEQVSGYSTGMMFFPGRVAIPVANLADLHEFIVKVAGSQQHFVTLGRAIGDTEGPWRRLKFDRFDERLGKTWKASVGEISETCLAVFDCDKGEVEAGSIGRDPRGTAIAEFDRMLPELRGSSFVYQYTSSAAPGGANRKLRFWVFLDRPVNLKALKRFAAARGFDGVTCSTHQPIYTARPLIVDDHGNLLPDFLPERFGLVERGPAMLDLSEFTVEGSVTGGGTVRGKARHAAIDGSIATTLDAYTPDQPLHDTLFRLTLRWLDRHGDAEFGKWKAQVAEMVAVKRPERLADVPAELDRILDFWRNSSTVETAKPADTMPPEQAQGLVRDVLRRALNFDMRYTDIEFTDTELVGERVKALVLASPGLGKTEIALQEIDRGRVQVGHRNPPRPVKVDYYMPSHDLGAELLARAAAINAKMSVGVKQGRTYAKTEDDEPLCERHEEVEVAQAAGVGNVETLFCRRKVGHDTYLHCPHYDECAYQQHKRDLNAKRLRIMPHQYLATPLGYEETPADVAIIDENFATSLVQAHRFHIDLLLRPLGWLFFGDTGLVLRCIGKALAEGRPIGEALYEGDGWKARKSALLELPERVRRALQATVKPDDPMPPDQLATALRELTQIPLPVLDALAAAARQGKHGSEWNVLVYDCSDRMVSARTFPALQRLDGVKHLVLLDGTAEPEIVQAVLPDDVPLEVIEAHVEQKLTIEQTLDFKGLMSWSKGDRAPVNVAADAVALQRRLGEGSRIAVIAPKQLADAIREMELPGTAVAHNQALRGRDHLKDFDGLVIAGRNLLPSGEAEGIARALWPHDRLLLNESYRYRRAEIRMEDGTVIGTRAMAHPDPQVDAVVRLTSGGELEQGIARLRAIHAERSRVVRVLTSHPLRGVALSKVIEGDPFMDWGAARLLVALARSDGTLPLVAKDMAARFPEMFSAEGKARQRGDDGRKSAEDAIRHGVPVLMAMGLVEVMPHKAAGKRGRPGRALRFKATAGNSEEVGAEGITRSPLNRNH
jgi:hypothetical protein